MHVRRNGFTLIELLVVIAIIAILAAILFPVFARAKRNAQVTTCLNNLKQCGQAILVYTDDHGGRYPYAGSLKCYAHPAGKGSAWWYEAVKRYASGNTKILICPVAMGDPKFKASIQTYGSTYQYYCAHSFAYLRMNYPNSALCGYSTAEVTAATKKPLLCEAYGTNHPGGQGSWQYPFMYCDGHVKAPTFGDWTNDLVPACYVGRDGVKPR
jgi:prepilin-type N-terminal cleavage/methylation domain-containing protein